MGFHVTGRSEWRKYALRDEDFKRKYGRDIEEYEGNQSTVLAGWTVQAGSNYKDLPLEELQRKMFLFPHCIGVRHVMAQKRVLRAFSWFSCRGG